MYFLQAANIYEKFDALRSHDVSNVGFWHYLSWALMMLLVGVVLYGLFRWLTQDRKQSNLMSSVANLAIKENSGNTTTTVGDPAELRPEVPSMGEDDDVLPPLSALPIGCRVSLFWDGGGLRCGSLSDVHAKENGLMILSVESDAVPKQGPVLLFARDNFGHMLIHRINIESVPQQGMRAVKPAALKPTTRLHAKLRTQTNLPAAVMRRSAEDSEQEPTPMLVRIHDLSVEGMGLLSEKPLVPNDQLVVRISFLGYVGPLSAVGKVIWAQRDVAGIYRAGIELEEDESLLRFTLADFSYATIQSESSALVMAKRQQDLAEEPEVVETPGA